MTETVLVAGGSGDIGGRIVNALLDRGAQVRVLTRNGGAVAAMRRFAGDSMIEIVEADYADPESLRAAAVGAAVVVSALSGARSVIVDAQRALLTAAVDAGVPRFIPSDYSADYRRITPGSNRNFELRREFAADLDAAPLRVSSILNGAFTDMLTGQAPIILHKQRRVLFWSSPDQVLDFTSKDDTARVTAQVAMDSHAPRVVEVAGDRVTARELATTMTELTAQPYRLQWAGTIGILAAMSTIARRASRDRQDAFPAWQGMQYLVSMFSGEAQLHHVNNKPFGNETWTTARDVLRDHFVGEAR